MIGQTEINYWWVRRRGLVMGLGGGTMSVVMVGGITNMMHYLTHVYGWRVTYLILGAMCVVTAILGATFFRDKPEVCHSVAVARRWVYGLHGGTQEKK